jgi:hypothetical protein
MLPYLVDRKSLLSIFLNCIVLPLLQLMFLAVVGAFYTGCWLPMFVYRTELSTNLFLKLKGSVYVLKGSYLFLDDDLSYYCFL